MLLIFTLFLAPILARAVFYAVGNSPRSWRDADWSSTGILPPASHDKAARVHRHHRRLEGYFLGP
jgi:hypothetical protein